MRKTKLCLSTSDQVGHTSRSVLQIIEDVAVNQSAMRNSPHDTESLFFLVGRLAPILAEVSFVSVIQIRKIATTFGPSWTLVLGVRLPCAKPFVHPARLLLALPNFKIANWLQS